jgi:hypothetical protein
VSSISRARSAVVAAEEPKSAEPIVVDIERHYSSDRPRLFLASNSSYIKEVNENVVLKEETASHFDVIRTVVPESTSSSSEDEEHMIDSDNKEKSESESHDDLMDEIKSVSSVDDHTIISSNSFSTDMVKEVSNMIMSGQSVAPSAAW